MAEHSRPKQKKKHDKNEDSIGEESLSFIVDESVQQTDVVIKVAAATFRAHSSILRQFSSCARGMPEPFTEWDLNTLTIRSGKPPAAKVVAAWLEALYWHDTSPNTPTTLHEAVPVLQFADAVGSPQVMFNTIINNIEHWHLDVPFVTSASNTQHTAMSLLGDEVFVFKTQRPGYTPPQFEVWQLPSWQSDSIKSNLIPLKNPATIVITATQYQAARHAAVEQLEELFFIAHKLRLKKLQRTLQAFLRQQLVLGADGFFHGTASEVLSSRVFHVLDHTAAADAWVKWVSQDDSLVVQPSS
jgi:hypothetical protein